MADSLQFEHIDPLNDYCWGDLACFIKHIDRLTDYSSPVLSNKQEHQTMANRPKFRVIGKRQLNLENHSECIRSCQTPVEVGRCKQLTNTVFGLPVLPTGCFSLSNAKAFLYNDVET